MSGLDPLAALAAQVLANANAAIEQATLDLGVATAEIQAQISVGDVIVATVLPAAGDGVDRITLLGQTVPAQLPPGINPGESIAVQVTGFTNTAVLVRNLGPVDPQNPPSAIDLPAPPPPPAAAVAAQTAILSTRYPATSSAAPVSSTAAPSPPAVSQATAPPAQASPPSAAPGPQVPNLTPAPAVVANPAAPLAPPREVFVAASVREAPAAIPEDIVLKNLLPEADLEARIALNRSGSAPPPSPPAAAGAAARAPAPAVTARAPHTPSAPLSGRSSVPPIITPSRAAAAARADRPAEAPPAARPATPEAALLTRLRIPISAATLTAARGVNAAAQSVTSSYQKLEALLADVAPSERVTALRSALAFVGKFDLRSVRTLPEQIASFVSNVVDGAESKIAQIVRTWAGAAAAAQTQAESEAEPQAPQSASGASAPTSNAPVAAQTSAAQNASPVVSAAVEARAAERMVALDHDVKAAIMALLESPPAGSSPQLTAALREALTATSALQFGVLASKNADTNSVTIPLPAYFYDGGKPAQIRISRDVPGGKNAMDADNFHVSFILDTKSLGTVGIDVQTVGRSVSVDVKTQATLAAERFRSSLGELRARLEGLRYRVATMAAGVAVGPAPAKSEADVAGPPESNSNVDMRA